MTTVRAMFAAAIAFLLITKGEAQQYLTKMTQGSDALWTMVEPFSIPDGQCYRDLRDKIICDDGLPPDGALVEVHDHKPFADIAISEDFTRVTVKRVAPCDGAASITVKLACQFN